MPHHYVANRLHCIFSTKNRLPLIPEELQPRAWAYMGGICHRLEVPVLAIGGIANHCHAFIALPPVLSLAKFMQALKANSSRWIAEQTRRRFAWQDSYGAFSVSVSHTDRTIRYVQTQPEHHRKRSFDEELRAFLKKHGMVLDPE